MPADLERIFQVARERRNWREPQPTAAAEGPRSPVEPSSQPRALPVPQQIFDELEAELGQALGPRLGSVRVQLGELRAACADERTAKTTGAPRVHKALDQLEDLIEALLLTRPQDAGP